MSYLFREEILNNKSDENLTIKSNEMILAFKFEDPNL